MMMNRLRPGQPARSGTGLNLMYNALATEVEFMRTEVAIAEMTGPRLWHWCGGLERFGSISTINGFDKQIKMENAPDFLLR